MIANPQIIGAALAEHPDLANTPMLKGTDDREAEVRQALRVFVVPQTQFIQIQMSSPVFGEAAKVVNAVVEAYLKHAQAIYDTSTQKNIDSLKPTRDAQHEEVLKQRTLVQSLSAQVEEGIVEQATNKSRASLDAYNRMSEQLTNVEIMVITAKAKLDQLKAAKELPRVEGKEQVDFHVNEAFLNHPAVVALQGKIDQAAQKLRKVERLVKHQNDPSYMQAAELMKDLNAQREDLWRQLEPTLRNQVTAGPVDNSIEIAIKEAELELNAKTVQKEALESRLSQLKIENNAAQAGQNKLEYAKKDLSREERVRQDRGHAEPVAVQRPEPGRAGRAELPGDADDPPQLRPPPPGHGRRAGVRRDAGGGHAGAAGAARRPGRRPGRAGDPDAPPGHRRRPAAAADPRRPDGPRRQRPRRRGPPPSRRASSAPSGSSTSSSRASTTSASPSARGATPGAATAGASSSPAPAARRARRPSPRSSPSGASTPA